MTRRSAPQKKADEIAFPVRVLLHGLGGGFLRDLGADRDPHAWIRINLGLGNAELYAWHTPYCQNGFQFLCRSPLAAGQFLAAFPEFRVADGTATEFYNSPHVTAGRRRGE